MKMDCEVVCDMMPLVMDGTASGKSREMVEEHVAECEPCRNMLEEMRQEIDREAERQKDTKLVRKLRRRRRARTALLVLLGMTLCLALAFFAKVGWDYYYDDFCVVTAMKHYAVEVAPHNYDGVQFILTALDGNAQKLSSYFDPENGDLYLWSTTTRRPRRAGSVWTISSPGGIYYRQGLGFAAASYEPNEDGNGMNLSISGISRIYKGAPRDRYLGDGEPVLLYEAQPVSFELWEAWSEEIAKREAERYPRDTGMDWLRQQTEATGADF